MHQDFASDLSTGYTKVASVISQNYVSSNFVPFTGALIEKLINKSVESEGLLSDGAAQATVSITLFERGKRD